MSHTDTLPFATWMRLNNGKGSLDEYQTYMKEQELKRTDSRGVDDMSDREVQNQLFILSSKNSNTLTGIYNILVFSLVITILSILVSLAMLV